MRQMKRFDYFVGQQRTIEFLRDQLRRREISPVMFVGPAGSGKLALAKLYAQALRCERVNDSVDPCGECGACQEVSENSSFRYIELDASIHNSFEGTRYVVRATQIEDDIVILVKDPEKLQPGVADVLLKVLERPKRCAFIFVAIDEAQLSPAVRSRCKIRHMAPVSPKTIRAHLSAICTDRGIIFEESAVELLSLAADGWIGRARSLLEDAARAGRVSLSNVRSALSLAGGEDLIQFSLALLRGEVDEAYRLSPKLGTRGLSAVQSFFRFCFVRFGLGCGTAEFEPALHLRGIGQEAWHSIEREWVRLADMRSMAVADCIREGMTFWAFEQDPVNWETVLVRFCRLLYQHPDGNAVTTVSITGGKPIL